MSAPKPETQKQAEKWQRVCRLAENAGLCPRCAAQLAWGAQEGSGGFSSIHPPCAPCTIVMLDWPVVRPNGWRTPSGRLSDAVTWVEGLPARRTATPTATSGGV
jgi:hypothetical protein